MDGVPIDASVPEIFSPTGRDSPTPETTTLPRDANILDTAVQNSSFNWLASFCSSDASIRMKVRAGSRISLAPPGFHDG